MNILKPALVAALVFLPLSGSLAQPIQCAILPGNSNTVLLSWNTIPGRQYEVQTTTNLARSWSNAFSPPVTLTAITNRLECLLPAADRARFFRVSEWRTNSVPGSSMALIPSGSFTMGDAFNEGNADERPTNTVYVSGFYMDTNEVSKAVWDEVYQWATNNGYSFDYGAGGEAASNPALNLTWHDAVKWCNARSEKETRTPAYYTNAAQTEVFRSGRPDVLKDWVKWGVGYRLPTEAEWEKAARGGAGGHRFPWSTTNNITHSLANYYSSGLESYDTSPTGGYNPSFTNGVPPYTSPVGYFTPNGYGLYDMAGNVWEWCWDWYSSTSYSTPPGNDPRGPSVGLFRVARGGSWFYDASFCRTASRVFFDPTTRSSYVGFRCVLPVGQP